MQNRTLHYDMRAIGVGIFLLIIAGIVLRDAFTQTISSVYGIGPAAMPVVVATLLVCLAIGHFFVAFRNRLPEAPKIDITAIGWISAGLVFLIACLAFGGGFIAAATVLFATTARAFGRSAFIKDLLIGFVIGFAIHITFSKVLTLALPAGPVEKLF